MIFSVLRMDMGHNMVLLHGVYDKLDPILNADLTTDFIYHENIDEDCKSLFICVFQK